MYQKKSISPIIALILLIVVSVVSVISFQNWYSTFSSIVSNDVEKKSIGGLSKIDIAGIVGNKLYITNKNDFENISIKDIKIGDVKCNISGNYSGSTIQIDISSCLNKVKTSTPDVVLVTDDKIIQKTFFIETKGFSLSLSCITDNDKDKKYLWTCYKYPIVIFDFEGFFDIFDNDQTVVGDKCWLRDDKSSCVSNMINDGCGVGTVYDKGTNICWLQNFSYAGDMNWTLAIDFCNNLTFASFDDWRLPTKQEMASIIDLGRQDPALVGGTNNFKAITSNFYWTYSTYGNLPSAAWVFGLNDGWDNTGEGAESDFDKSKNFSVTCMRYRK